MKHFIFLCLLVCIGTSAKCQSYSLGGAPRGAATAVLQATGNTSLGSIDTKLPALVSGRIPVDLGGAIQPISAASLPLPSGAATAALQSTGNTSLGSLDTKTPALVNGRSPVDGSGVVQPISAASLPLPSGAATAVLQTTANTSLGSINTKLPALVSGRIPVDLGGATQPISAASLPLPSGAATAALQTTGNTSLANIDTKTPALINGRIPVDVNVSGAIERIPFYWGRSIDAGGGSITNTLSELLMVQVVGNNSSGLISSYTVPANYKLRITGMSFSGVSKTALSAQSMNFELVDFALRKGIPFSNTGLSVAQASVAIMYANPTSDKKARAVFNIEKSFADGAVEIDAGEGIRAVGKNDYGNIDFFFYGSIQGYLIRK